MQFPTSYVSILIIVFWVRGLSDAKAEPIEADPSFEIRAGESQTVFASRPQNGLSTILSNPTTLFLPNGETMAPTDGEHFAAIGTSWTGVIPGQAEVMIDKTVFATGGDRLAGDYFAFLDSQGTGEAFFEIQVIQSGVGLIDTIVGDSLLGSSLFLDWHEFDYVFPNSDTYVIRFRAGTSVEDSFALSRLGVDNLRYLPVPEPSTLALLGLSIAGGTALRGGRIADRVRSLRVSRTTPKPRSTCPDRLTGSAYPVARRMRVPREVSTRRRVPPRSLNGGAARGLRFRRSFKKAPAAAPVG